MAATTTSRNSSNKGKHILQTNPLEKGRACTACKLRKVRCDAVAPSCGACRRTARFEGRDPTAVVCCYQDKKTRAAAKGKGKEKVRVKAVVVAKPKSARLARREASDEEEDEDAEGESDDEEDLEKIVLVAELETRMNALEHIVQKNLRPISPALSSSSSSNSRQSFDSNSFAPLSYLPSPISSAPTSPPSVLDRIEIDHSNDSLSQRPLLASNNSFLRAMGASSYSSCSDFDFTNYSLERPSDQPFLTPFPVYMPLSPAYYNQQQAYFANTFASTHQPQQPQQQQPFAPVAPLQSFSNALQHRETFAASPFFPLSLPTKQFPQSIAASGRMPGFNRT